MTAKKSGSKLMLSESKLCVGCCYHREKPEACDLNWPATMLDDTVIWCDYRKEKLSVQGYLKFERILYNRLHDKIDEGDPHYNTDGLCFMVTLKSVGTNTHLRSSARPSLQEAREELKEWAMEQGVKIIDDSDGRSDLLQEIDMVLTGSKTGEGTGGPYRPAPTVAQVRAWRRKIKVLEEKLDAYRSMFVKPGGWPPSKNGTGNDKDSEPVAFPLTRTSV